MFESAESERPTLTNREIISEEERRRRRRRRTQHCSISATVSTVGYTGTRKRLCLRSTHTAPDANSASPVRSTLN